MKTNNLEYRKNKWSHWWTLIIVFTLLATIFLTIGMTAKIIEVRYGEFWSLAQIINYHKSSAGFYTDLFKMATNHTVGFSYSFRTAIAISFTGFGLFIVDIFIILLYIVKVITKINIHIQIREK